MNDFEVLRVLAVFFFFGNSAQIYNKIIITFSFYNIRQNQG